MIMTINYNKYLERLKSNDNNIEEYHYKLKTGTLPNYDNKRFKTGAPTSATILNHLISISKLFETDEQRNESWRSRNKDFNLNHNNINKLTKQDIKDFIDSDWWNNLLGSTKNMHLNRIKKYLKYSERNDLLELLPNKYNDKKNTELIELDLLTREDLEQILKYSNFQYKVLFMILYDGGLRIDEALNLREKDIKFISKPKHTVLKIIKSKTDKRDVPVVEADQYIKQYLEMNDFEPEDKLFDFKNNTTVNNYLNFIFKKLIKKHPEQWKGRRLYPHLFRHSRMTELARGGANESQLIKFGGWSADSNVVKIYIHLVDKDITNLITGTIVEAPKPKKPKMCGICNTENSQINLFCWKCGNVFSEEDKEQMGIEIITQPHEVRKLREENKELKDELVAMKDLYKEEMNNMREELKSMFDDLYYRKEKEQTK